MICNLGDPMSLRHPVWVTWLIYLCDMTDLFVRHDLFRGATWLMTREYAQHDSSHTRMSHITHLFVRHDSFMCATWLVQMRHVTRECATRMGDMTHLFVRHDVFRCATWLMDTRNMIWLMVIWLMNLCDKSCCTYLCELVTHGYAQYDLPHKWIRTTWYDSWW